MKMRSPFTALQLRSPLFAPSVRSPAVSQTASYYDDDRT